MSVKYKHILSPIKVGNLVFKNRLVSGNALPHFLQGPESWPAEPTINHMVTVAKNGAATGASLLIGLGGSLDVFAGRVERAPEGWQKAGMEWLYRAIKQAERLKRVAKLPLFLVSAAAARIKGK